ncbi:Dedicator of cytokinesis protein 4, partial [Bonamia ostreae]
IQGAKNSKSIVVSLFSYKGNFNKIIENNRQKNLDKYEIIGRVSDETSITLKKRIDMLVTLVQGKFTQENIKYVANQKIKQLTKKKPKNIQVLVRLLHSNGEFLKNCFHNSAESVKPCFSVFKTFIIAHENSPVYKEKFYIKIEEELLSQSFLYIEYRHVSVNTDKTCVFGFSFIPLGQKNKILDNDTKDLIVYCASNILDGKLNVKLSKDFIKRKDRFILSTYYNSTEYSQNEHLNLVLHWKQNSSNVIQSMKNFNQINGRILLNSFRKTLDCLFDMLEESQTTNKNLIFDCIIHVIHELTCKLKEKRNLSIQYYTKKYIGTTFRNKNSHVFLVSEIKKLFEDT